MSSPEPDPTPQERMQRGYARSEARNAEIRAGLEPLAPDERPGPLRVAIGVCVLLLVANVALPLAGYEVNGKSTTSSAAVFSVLLAATAYGMWVKWYPAVLAFQALLALTIITASLSLLVASNALAAVLCVAVIGLGGWLFWKLVRVLSRMQAPGRSRPEDVR